VHGSSRRNLLWHFNTESNSIYSCMQNRYFHKKICKEEHALGELVCVNPDGIQDSLWLNQKAPCKYSALAAWPDSMKVLFPTGQKSAPAKIWWISRGRMAYILKNNIHTKNYVDSKKILMGIMNKGDEESSLPKPKTL